MKNKILPIVFSLIFIIIFILFYKGLQDTSIYTPKSKIKDKVPIFSAKLFNSNKTISSSELFKSDKFYLLNIWSSWCVPCRKEHPLLMELSLRENIELIGLNYKDKNKNANSFLNELGNPYKEIIFDKEGIYAIEWGAYGVPETFIIYNNMIIEKYIGPLNEQSLNEIKNLIK
jgi:cytochrome c biogenesis protein CcmG/thiol:disulfide interchange protein DsbE